MDPRDLICNFLQNFFQTIVLTDENHERSAVLVDKKKATISVLSFIHDVREQRRRSRTKTRRINAKKDREGLKRITLREIASNDKFQFKCHQRRDNRRSVFTR